MSRIALLALLCLLVDVRGHEATQADGKVPSNAHTKSILSNIQNFLQGLYQDFLTRQQSIANLLTCGNCVNEGWEAIMAAAANVPGLEWAYKPDGSDHQPSFFTALNQDGVITGFGGSIINNKPVVEFVFNQTGIIERLNATNPELLKQ